MRRGARSRASRPTKRIWRGKRSKRRSSKRCRETKGWLVASRAARAAVTFSLRRSGAEMGIPTWLYLAIPPERYVVSSVQKAGERWVERFWKLYNKQSEQKRVRVLSEATDVVNEREYLPAWLRSKPDYGIWQRNNLWTLFNALAEPARETLRSLLCGTANRRATAQGARATLCGRCRSAARAPSFSTRKSCSVFRYAAMHSAPIRVLGRR